ncbi:MAG: DUF4185 domain-containing protein [Planctomycetes bacterium]|nr:DUF4185 domain-containing protein [Planctomycetota bacterium]
MTSHAPRVWFVAIALTACATAPIPEPSVIVATTFLPEIVAGGAREAHVLYQDGALPTPVPGGTLWTFGDTFLGTRNPDGSPAYAGDRSNTLALLPAGERDFPPKLRYLRSGDGVAKAPLALLDGENQKTRRLWPLAGVQLGGHSYMFYGLLDVTGPGPWGFKPVGTGLARSEQPFATYERLAPTGGGWPIDPTSIVRRDGWLYLYTPRRFHGEQELRSGLLIARVRPADVEQPHDYEFFAGLGDRGVPSWTAHVEDAIEAADGVWGQASVAWHPAVDGFLLATSANLFHANGIQLRRSATPWGPWSPLSPDDGWITVPERQGEQTPLVYCTMLHPELDAPGERTVTLTFCRMLKREWAFTNPEVVRVELGRGAR